MTVPPVITPLLQWSDANGNPYAGGTIECYIIGTSTPKTVWIDPGQAAVATNPVVLDAAGRSLMFGDGDYRLILRDAAGNLIADFPATTLVSAAMYPVVSAPTIADAVHLLGIDDLIASEAAARAAADSAEQTYRIANDNAEIAARAAADANLQSLIDALTTRVTALEGAGGGLPIIKHGFAITNSDGHLRVTFDHPFTTAPAITLGNNGAGYGSESEEIAGDTTGFDIWFAYLGSSGIVPLGATPFYWIAAGT